MQYDKQRRLSDLKLTDLNVGFVENPLDFIADDHMREREVCAMIDKMVPDGNPEKGARKRVISFLTVQLPHHLLDEEIDVFPLMLARCAPEDEIEKVINKLQSDHGHARSDTPLIISRLRTNEAFSRKVSAQMIEFATHARRHLILENAIILPIARARLTDEDLSTMKQHMIERRDRDPLAGMSQC